MKEKMTLRLVALALVSVGLCRIPLAAGMDLESLDRYIRQALEAWNVPGLSIAIVQDDRVVFSEGYGVREMGGDALADADTLFAIASNSKAFTTASLAILVDEGKIDWDDPVRDYLPYFTLYSPYVSNEMRLRDLLCHRSGLGTFSGDLLWYLTGYSREEVVRRARLLPQKVPFRAGYGYSNLMFIAAGEVIPVVTGESWDRFLQTRIFQPLGMARTVTSVDRLSALGNVATPHADFDGELVTHPWAPWDAMAPAGGVISCARDMAKWLRLQLGRGEWEGSQIFSRDSAETMWSQHNILPVSQRNKALFPSTHFRGYGLGWSLWDYLGERIVSHGGAYDGMFSQVALVPDKGFGLVVLTNATTSIQQALMYRVLDAFLGGEERDWSQILLERHLSRKQSRTARREADQAARVPGTQPSLALESYAGTYGGPLYGDAEIRVEGGKLVLQFLPASELVGELSHWHYDVFEITWRRKFPWFGKGKVQFLMGADGKVAEFKMDVPNEDFWFHELEFKKSKGRP